MEKYSGKLERVGNLTGGDLVSPVDSQGNKQWVGSYRSASEIDAIQIGSTVLKKPRCEDALFSNLRPGHEASLYVYRHFRTPVLLGVQYTDGTSHLISSSYLRGTMLQFAVVLAFMYGIGGLIAGGILGSILLPGDLPAVVALLGGMAAGGWCWYQAYQIRKDYGEAKADMAQPAMRVAV
jgi:hypothetical protein